MDLVDDPSAPRVVALLEITGIKSSDITLQIRDSNLLVMGTRTPPTLDSLKREFTSDEKEIKPEDKDVEMKTEVPKSSPANVQVPIQELRYGSFYRAIRIPDDIQESDVSATLHEGMLKVTWPRVSAMHQPLIPTFPPPSRTSSISPNPGHPSSTNNASQ
jgi:HSP20 family molecular chaperone IbpA